MPVGLDTAIIPSIPNNRTEIRRALKIDEHARVFIFVGRLDPYKQPLDLVPLLQAAPDWYAIIIGRGSLGDELTRRLTDAGLLDRCRLIPQLPNEQVHVYYHACDAFVNLNPNEISDEPAGGHVRGLPAGGAPRPPAPTLSLRTVSAACCAAPCPSWPQRWTKPPPPWAMPPRAA